MKRYTFSHLLHLASHGDSRAQKELDRRRLEHDRLILADMANAMLQAHKESQP